MINEVLKATIQQQINAVKSLREAAVTKAVQENYSSVVAPRLSEMEKKKTDEISAIRQSCETQIASVSEKFDAEKETYIANEKQQIAAVVGAEFDVVLTKYQEMLNG